MKKTILILILIVLISGCSPKCPETCNDNNPCTSDSCGEETEFQCKNVPLNGPQPGCSAEVDCGTKTCKDGVCGGDYEKDCCGNDICELGETYSICITDCPNCDDDNKCTKDSYDYHKQECINAPIIPCCGNNLCDEETTETYLTCETDCPNCDDDNKLTGDIFNYATQKCEYTIYYFFEDFNEGSASWSLDPRWAVVFQEDETNGMLTKVDDATYAYTSFGDQTWTDYNVRLKVKLDPGGVEINVRSSGEEGNYAVSLSENQIILAKDVEPRIDFETKYYSFDPNQFYNIKIGLKGNNIKVYVDEELQIDYTDTDKPLPTGNVGLYISNNSYFDYVIIEAP